jgi:hypothetical protein
MYGGSSLRRDRPRLGAHLYRQLYHRPGERPLRSLSRRHHGHPQADGERPRHHTALGRQLTSANLCGSCHNILLPVFDNAGNLLRASYVQSTHLEWTNYATLTLKGVRPSTSPRRTDTGPLCAPIAAARRGHIRLTRSSHPGRWGLERRCRDARQVTGKVEDDCPWRLGGGVRCLGAWLSREAYHDKVSVAIQRRCASVSASV